MIKYLLEFISRSMANSSSSFSRPSMTRINRLKFQSHLRHPTLQRLSPSTRSESSMNTIRIVSTPIQSLKIPQILTRFRASKLPGGHRWRQRKVYQGVERFDEKLCRLIFFRKYIYSLILISCLSLYCLPDFLHSSQVNSKV